MDYSGAYDRVSVKGLLGKLGSHNCPPQMLLWLRAFLVDRKAYCRWGDSKCKQRVVPNGLPKGSSLSCLLWDLYILDLPSKINEGNISPFADDTMVWTMAKNYQQCLPVIQSAIRAIEDYCGSLWNLSKTVLMPFGNKKWDPPDISISICGETVQGTDIGKYLGVTIDSKLPFHRHVQRVTDKNLRRCRVLASLCGRSWGANESTLQITRKAILESITNYACAIWAPHLSESNVGKI